MNCIKCGGDIFCKNGVNTGIQRYKCKKCGVNFTKNRASKPLHLKRLALELYLEGLGFRSIGRILKVSHVSIYNWIRKFGEKAQELRKNDEISVVEIDEMHTYIGSKKTQLGYGFLLIDIEKNSSILSSEIDLQAQEKAYFKP